MAPATPDCSEHRLSWKVAWIGDGIAICLAVLALTGWITGLHILASMRSSYIPMAPGTACLLLLLGTLIASGMKGQFMPKRLNQVAAFFVVLFGFLKLVEFFSGADILEIAFIRNPGQWGAVPIGRMSPITAACFILSGGSLSLLSMKDSLELRKASSLLALPSLWISGVTALGYLYRTPLLYGINIIPVALTTALAFIAINIALLMASDMDVVPFSYFAFAGPSPRALMMRTFLPIAAASVVMEGWMYSLLADYSHINQALAAVFLALFFALILSVLIFRTSRTVDAEIAAVEAQRRSTLEHSRKVLAAANEKLELRVQERTAELQNANMELEAFAHSVSHDLKAPLRHISGFAQILVEDAGPKLSESDRSSLAKILEAARRMESLISDLLSLSLTSRAEMKKTRVSLASLAESVLKELEPETQGRRIIWKIAELPQAQCDPTLLRQVFVNLLRNAIKFTRTRGEAIVEIGAYEHPGKIVVFVRDNGVGFDKESGQKLFKMFQRLHSQDEFEGNGIGLSNVARIVRRHGGEAWAEGVTGKGATFYFSLPCDLVG